MPTVTATKKLPLGPDDPRSVAFRKLVSVLQDVAALKRKDLNTLWRTPDDAHFDDDLPDNRVAIQLTPRLLPAEPVACVGYGRRSYLSPVEVAVEIRVPGFLWDNSMNLWGAIESALGPQSNRIAFDAALRASGISDLEIDQPEAPLSPNETAVGKVRLIVYTVA